MTKKYEPQMNKILGKKVLAIKGHKIVGDRIQGKYFEPKFILFDDEITYIELEDQNYYDYRDCATSAKHIYIRVSGIMWEKIMHDDKEYPKINTDI
jgi:hypothetical protein